jgi:CPA1 family monovalent cation:H+ antiporter
MALARAQVRDRVTTIAKEMGLPRAPGAALEPVLSDSNDAYGPSTEDELTEVGLQTLANREAALYVGYYQSGIVDRKIVERLQAQAGRLKDAVKTGGVEGYSEYGRKFADFTGGFRRALWLQRSLGFEGPLRAEIADRFEVLLVQNRALRDLSEHAHGTLTSLLGPGVAARMEDFLSRRAEQVRNALDALELQYPAFADCLRERYAERVGITLEEAEYQDQMRQSVIAGEVYADLAGRLDQRRRVLERRPPLDLGLRLQQMMAKLPFFAELEEEDLAQIARRLRPQLAVPGQEIIRKGEIGDQMYFIASGEVDVVLPDRLIPLGPGDFFGELALLDDAPRSADVRARTYCNVLVLSRRDFRRLLNQDPALKAQIERVAAGRRASEAPLAAAQ